MTIVDGLNEEEKKRAQRRASHIQMHRDYLDGKIGGPKLGKLMGKRVQQLPRPALPIALSTLLKTPL